MMNTELREYTKASGKELAPALRQRMQSSVASINTGAFGAGAFIGPMLASCMVEFMSY